MVEPTTRDRGDPVDADHGGAVEGSAEGVPEQGHMPPLAELVRGARSVEGHLARGPRRAEREATAQPRSGLPRRILHGCEKRGEAVGLTKRGKGTKLVVLVSGEGVPLGVQVAAASASEASLAIPTLEELNDVVVDGGIAKPRFVVADKGYDSDPLRDAFAARGVTLLSPHRRNRKRPTRNDGRHMKRYRRRWVVERTFGWFHNFRRLVTRYDRTLRAFRAFVHVACVVLALRHL